MGIADLPSHKGYFYDPESGRMFKEVRVFGYDANRGRSTTLCLGPMKKLATHLMFYIMTGRWPHPGMHMDHKDGNHENTRWRNLREATREQNAQNRQPIRNPADGLVSGVSMTPQGKFKVQIQANGVKVYFGVYVTKEEANEVAVRKRKELHKEFAVENRPLERRF